MNKIKYLLPILGALACAGTDSFDDSELGTDQQAFQGANTPTWQYGTRTATSRGRCDKLATGQVCVVPDHKNQVFAHDSTNFPGGFQDADRTLINAAMGGLASALPHWAFRSCDQDLFTGQCISTVANPISLHYLVGAVGPSGTASNDINDYVKVTFGTLVDLTEGPGVVGAYQSSFGCNITVDITDLNAKGTTATQKTNLKNHAFVHGALLCLGIGGRPLTGSFASRTLVQGGTPATALTSGEKCVMDGYVASKDGKFILSPTSCPSD